MDELLIEEKRYVSSKRAAKVTGYAKDYIGQLCREGRVPARLVGRSWYVLESAIHDHRFGNPDQKTEITEPIVVVSKQIPTAAWESPRYEASKAEILPSVNRLRDIQTTPVDSPSEAPQPLQDSWRAWFDRVADEPVASSESEEQEVEEKEPAVVEEEVPIPIHTIYELPPEDLLPRHVEVEPLYEQQVEEPPYKRERGGVLRVMQVAGMVVAVLVATVAVIGTGYFDMYIISNRQVGLLAGVAVYNR